MTTSEKQKVWIVLDHPMQFSVALSLAAYWGQKNIPINLLISRHPYWSSTDMTPYEDRFDKVIFLERPDYAWHPVQLLKNISSIRRIKKKIVAFHIAPDDIIIGLSVFHYLENVVLSMHLRNKKVAIMTEVVYQESNRSMNKAENKPTLVGWMANWLVEPLSGLYRTYCMKDRINPEAYWRIRYRASLTEIYDKVIVIGNLRREEMMPGEVMSIPNPYALALGEARVENYYKTGRPKRVIYFGDAFRNGYLRLSRERYANHLNKCLSFLREKYGASHRLIYRPHPQETDEISFLNLDQFEIERDGMLAELYLYENYDDIHAVFSLCSTPSRIALHYFINSYVFLETFPFDEEAKKLSRLEMCTVPDGFFLKNLHDTPKRYIKAEDITAAFKQYRDVLDTIL